VVRPVRDELPRDEDRQLHVELQLHHLERRRVLVPHEVADEAAVLADALRAEPVADARRLHDGRVAAHVVDEIDEAAVETRDLAPDPLVGLGRTEALAHDALTPTAAPPAGRRGPWPASDRNTSTSPA